MNKVFKRGSIEFLAVFLGIALSLWVDDYREERELNNRLNDDFKKIYSEDQSKIDLCNSQILEFIKDKKIEIVDR